MPDGQVVFEITADGKHAIASIKDVTKAVEAESKKWDNAAAEGTGGIEKAFSGMLKKVVAGMSAAKVAQTLLSWGKAAVQAASDLQEVQNVVDVTFGDSANQIETWAKKAGQQFGLTETQAKKFTSTLGAMMKSAGMAGPEIVTMSTDLAGLAADMASFYNLDFETAFQKIRSGISGETEPLKQLGINMSVANLEAFALTKGITKAFNTMSQSEQTMLRYQYLMQATADAQGDFARTSDGFANAQRRIETAIDSIKTSLGTTLMPVVGEATDAIAGFLEKITASPETTVLDEFNSIDLDTEAKLADIQRIAEQADALVGTLEQIGTQKVHASQFNSVINTLSTDINSLESALNKAEEGDFVGAISGIAQAMELQTGTSASTWADLLKTITENLPDTIEAIDGDTTTEAWLKAAADAANSLGGQYPGLWNTLLTTLGADATATTLQLLKDSYQSAGTLGILAGGANKLDQNAASKWQNLASAFDGMDGFEGVVQAAQAHDYQATLNNLSGALANTTGFTEGKWATLLQEITNNLPAANSYTGNETVSDFLDAAATAANKLGGEYPEMWASLVEALGDEKAGAMISALAGAQNAGTYLGTIADSANKLDANSKQHWEGVLSTINKVTGNTFGANATSAKDKINALATALSGGNINQTRAEAFKELITTLTANAGSLTELGNTNEEGIVEFLTSIGEAANTLDENDAEGWSTLLTALATGLSGGLFSDTGAEYFSTLSSYFLMLGSDSETAKAGLRALGYSEEEIADAQRTWIESCKELIKTIPGLSEIINAETGEVEGGKDAIDEYVKAWEQGQKKLAMLQALNAKESALAAKFGELPGLELDLTVARYRLKKQLDTVKALYAQYGLWFGVDSNGKAVRNFSDVYGLTNEQKAELNAAADAFNKLSKEAEDTYSTYKKQKDAYDEASAALEEYREVVDDMEDPLGIAKEGIDGTTEALEEQKQAALDAANAVQEAAKQLADYYENAFRDTESSIRSTLKGFEEIVTPGQQAERELQNLNDELAKLGPRTEENAAEWDRLNSSINNFGKKRVSAYDMEKGLDSQVKYMEQYLKDMETARGMGFSNDLLASLADGSVESADYLRALVNATPEQIAKLNSLWSEREELTGMLASYLTDQKMTVDETYQEMVEKAKQAVAEMDLQSEAAEASGKTVQGIAEGITAHTDEVSVAVDGIIAELDRLTSYGIDVTAGGFGNPLILNGSHESGLDYVPFDNYLAALHEGEGILTAEENRIWQRFKNGGRGDVDYDTLGGVMRDNIHAGGNVYLNGQIVGRVVSQEQAQSFRNLTRSGWQS